MAVFRVERNKGYTVMSNHHLRNKELSLKAKGLLSQMLSLPEDWDYTLKGLSLINREKIDAIREAIKELERAGYIVRSRERDEKGRLRGADYVIFEQPQPPTPDLPTLENPTLDNPMQEKPTLEKPTLENPTQLNKDIQRTDLPKKEKSNTDLSSTHSIPILSPNPSPCREAAAPPERKGTEAAAQSAVDIYREIIKDNIDYHILKQDMKFDSSKNADYGAAEAYLTFEHDEFTMKPTLDENGRLIPREDYRISSINCGDEDFAVACMRANLRYEKNQKREDVKSHHYIISFDPRDGTDNGLTVDRAQELGEQFCKEHFPGHQALICTHPDGHNHSGNIHVHIVINSLRIYEVPLLPYMDRPADTLEGCKHRCTNAAMEYFKSEVMEMCHREGLYQIDLLNGSKERITEREYWAAKKGQLALDKENAAREAAGQPTKPTKFETDKAKLRRTIRQALSQAGSFDEFASLLLREGVTVKESRGRLSYLTPDRTKPITARKLGDDFDKAAVLALLTQNAHRAAEQTTAIPEYPHTQKERLREEKTAKTAPADNTLQRMVDREAKRAEGKGVGYDRWASLHNLKQMAATHNFLMENELLDLDKLDAAVESSRKALSEARESLRGIEQSISDKKSLRKVVNDYRRTRPTIDAHKKLSGRKAENYRQSHEAEFIIYEAALRQLKVLAPGKKLPATSKLNTEIEALISEKNAAYNTYRTAKAEYEQLATAKRNAEQILHGTPSRQKKHEQER